MQSFEQEFKTFLTATNIACNDHCESHKLLDFTLPEFYNGKPLRIDVKEKRQRLNTKNWPSVTDVEEAQKFILDDLAARKIIACAPYSGLLVRDNITTFYHWFSVMDLALMPKVRLNRPIQKNVLQYKGKWLIDFRNAVSAKSLADVFAAVKKYCAAVRSACTEYLPCYGQYYNENIPVEGEIRRSDYWDTDVKETR